MPKKRSPLRDKAYEMFKEYSGSIENRRIAETLGVPEKTVGSWKCKDKWSEKLSGVLQSNERSTPKVRGAPAGNKNAAGNKGLSQPGNKNNYKHGIYERLLFSTLSEEEKELMSHHEMDPVEELKKTASLCDLQIIRLMELIKEAREKAGGLAVSGITKKKSSVKGIERGEDDDYTEDNVTTNTVATYELILRYNNEIEKIKGRKIRCLETLIKMGHVDARLELEREKLNRKSGGDGNIDLLMRSIKATREGRKQK